MPTQNGQSISPEGTPAKASADARNASQFSKFQSKFLEDLLSQGVEHVAVSLRLIHELALYHSDIPLDQQEKEALYDMKLLWEGLEQMGNE